MMNNIFKKRPPSMNTIKSVLDMNKHQKLISSQDTLMLEKPVKERSTILGLKITKVVFQDKEYIVKANRYLLLLILRFLLENNKINLKEDLPLKTNNANNRCILNDKPFHPNKNIMSDIHIIKTISKKLYSETKLCTYSIHNGCYGLLRRYNLPIGDLKIEYSKKRPRVDHKYVEALNAKGYYQIDKINLTDNLKTKGLNSAICKYNKTSFVETKHAV